MSRIFKDGLGIVGNIVGKSASKRASPITLIDTPPKARYVRSAIDEPGILANVKTRKDTTIKIHAMSPLMQHIIAVLFPGEKRSVTTSGARIHAEFVGRSSFDKSTNLLYGTQAAHDNLTTLTLGNRSLGDVVLQKLVELEQDGINVLEQFPTVWKTAIAYRARESEATSTLSFVNQSWVPVERRMFSLLTPITPRPVLFASEEALISEVHMTALQTQSTLNPKMKGVMEGVYRDLKCKRLTVRRQGKDQWFPDLPFEGDGLQLMEAMLENSSASNVSIIEAVDNAVQRVPELFDELIKFESVMKGASGL